MTHLWLLLFLNSWLQSEAQGFGINLIKVPDDDRAQIVCTVALLGKYFHSGEALSGSVLHMSITTANAHVQKSLLHALHTNPNYPWTIVVKDTHRDSDMEGKVQHVLHEKPQCYFFVIENMEDEDMDEVFESWKSNLNWNPLAQFVVYFSSVEETEEEMTDIMIEILLNFMNKKIYNVNIIGQSEESSFYFGKTVFPYHPDNNCGNRVISIETLDICDYQESEKEEDEDDEEEEEDEDNDGMETEVEVGDGKDVEDGKNENTDNQNSSKSNENVTDEEQKENGNDNQNNSKSNEDNEQKAGDEEQNEKDSNSTQSASEYPKIYIEELYRALFLDKFPKDLSGCPLVAAYRPWEPYIFNEALDNSLYTTSTGNNQTSYNNTYDGDEDIDTNDDDNDDYITYNEQQDMDAGAQGSSSEIRLNGIEYKMIQTIAERLHISIEMQVENTNLYHLFQQLIDGDIEMVVGGIDEDPSISQFVSSTIPYHQDDLTWCVSKAHHTTNLFNFMATFQIGAWILTLIFILTASLSIFMSQQYLRLRLGFLKSYFSINVYVMGIVLSQAINLRPIPTSLKLCFGATFFMGLMFSNIYQSFLVSTLTTPKSSYQISHLNEIYQNRMHIMGSVDNVRHLNKEGEIYRYVREHFQMCYNIEECLQRAAKDTKLAVAVSRQHSFYNPRIPRDSLYCFDRNENIYVYLVTMLMPKKFHLLHKINPVIQHIIESGHMQKWARDLDMRRKISEEIQRAREEPFKSLTLSQVAGSFAFNGLLLLFATWMFVMEHAVYWLVVRRRTRLKLAKYMHRKLV
ncbi:uncharacterized protein LOC119610797 [Lucilia sericata]|uniref:uncharacterized protein LOC119610797 n=1 Tax=Lucilia sericata TaxID=13632 RepID=UPI0018A80D57|nr:uncharacterized protein LOC119610797 [Lucilia sericata]